MISLLARAGLVGLINIHQSLIPNLMDASTELLLFRFRQRKVTAAYVKA